MMKKSLLGIHLFLSLKYFSMPVGEIDIQYDDGL